MKKKTFLLALILMIGLRSFAYITVSGNITTDQTWTSGNTYFVSSTVVVLSGITLNIENNVVVKFNSGQGIRVFGTLNCTGTLGNEIHFTSYHDNSLGETISGSLGNPNEGDWGSVFIWDTDASANISYANFKYGGFSSSSTPVLKFTDAQPSTMDHIFIRYGYNYGLSIKNTNVLVDYLDISNQHQGIYLEDGSTSNFSNVWIEIIDSKFLSVKNSKLTDLSAWHITATENQYIKIKDALADSSVFKNADGIVYVLNNDVSANKTYFYEGTIVKAAAGASLVITNGKFRTMGNQNLPVIFTSLKDDIGGDTNGDGTVTSPAPGDWKGVILDGINSSAITPRAYMQYTWIRYGGADWNGYSTNLFLREVTGNSTVSHCRMEHSSGAGVRIASSSPGFSSSSFYNNGEDVLITGNSVVPDFGNFLGKNLFRNTIAIDNFGTHTIYAKGNDWGTNDSATIAQRVGNNVPSTGEVFFDPWFGKEDEYWCSYDKTAIENAGVYSQTIIPYADAPAGTVILYQTGEGRYGKMKILQRTLTSMTLWWETYNSDGTTHSAGTSLSLNSIGDRVDG